MVFDGRKLAQKILDDLKAETANWPRKPSLAVVSFGSGSDNSSYILQKRRAARSLGFGFEQYHCADISPAKTRAYLNKIAQMDKHSAVVVQMPLPANINPSAVNVIPVSKDPDLLSDRAVGMFFNGRSVVEPPTAQAILAILDEAGVETRGKTVVVFGFGRLVGRFLVPMFLGRGAVVSVVEWGLGGETLLGISQRADIIVSAAGDPKFLSGDMIKTGAVVVDAGFSLVDGEIAGDVDFESVAAKASLITSVPGGVGPVSVAQLFTNVVCLYKRNNRLG